MKTETEKKLENLKKSIKTCPTCGKEFLGLDVWAIHCDGEDRKHSDHGIDKYKLECGKCPKCQEQCPFYHEMFYTNSDLWTVSDDGIKLFIDYVKKFKKMPCSEGYGLLEWYKDTDDIKKDDLFNDDSIKDYVETWLDYSLENDNICYCRLGPSFEYVYDLIDLLDFFK